MDLSPNPMSDSRIFDPASPNLHGYQRYRYNECSIGTFVSAKAYQWWSHLLWALYGRDQIVAVYLHREQTLTGTVQNWMARRILDYIYGPESDDN